MRLDELRARAAAIAANRTAGASELTAALLPLLDVAVEAGRDATLAIARSVCPGQPAMAPLWNACAAALAEFDRPGRYARVRAEITRAPQALERVALAALGDALLDVPHPRLRTLSYSGSVARTLRALAAGRTLDVVCAESLPGGEGARMHAELQAAGARSELVHDAELSRALSGAHAVVVGADALAAHEWTNKVGTFALAAAASFRGVPVYVVSGREKAAAAPFAKRAPLPRLFETIPASLATLFLTDAGPIPPDQLSAVSERFAADLDRLLAQL